MNPLSFHPLVFQHTDQYSFLTDKHDMEYLEILDKNTLEEQVNANDDSIALIACRVEGVRLIDNIYLG